MKKITLALFASSTLILAACNTIEGASKDVKSVGEEAEETVEEVGDNI